MRLVDNSSEYFEQNADYVLEYLKKRGLENKAFNDFISDFKFGLIEGVKFSIDKEPFEVSHLLGKSKVAGYDIILANRNLGLADGDDIAIGLVLGDDVICYNIAKKNVSLYFIQTGDGEMVEIDDTLEAFIKRFE